MEWIRYQRTDVNCRNYHFTQTLAVYYLVFLLSELRGHGLALIITAVFYNPREREDDYHFKCYNLISFANLCLLSFHYLHFEYVISEFYLLGVIFCLHSVTTVAENEYW